MFILSFPHWLSRKCVCMCVCSLAVGDLPFTFLLSLLAWPPSSTWVPPCWPWAPLLSSLYVHILSVHLPLWLDRFSGGQPVSSVIASLLGQLEEWQNWPIAFGPLSLSITSGAQLSIYVAPFLPETLAVWPEGDVGRLPCAGTSLRWSEMVYIATASE